MASASLKRSRTAGSTKTKFTLSMWFKRSSVDAKYLAVNYTSDSNRALIQFGGADNLIFQSKYSNSNNAQIETNRKFRDTSGWYHIVLIGDSTLATAADRTKLYVNGVRETSFSQETQISQDGNYYFNEATTNGFRIGEKGDGSDFFDGCMSHVVFLDGVAAAHTDFGSFDSTTGIWKATSSPSVTYGTNGFFLKFDNSANMGLDSSGLGNNLTTTGTIIQTKDTPTNVFTTLNPLRILGTANASLTKVATQYNTTSNSWGNITSTLAFSKGKYYAEFKFAALQSSSGYGGMGITDAQEAYNANDNLVNNSATSAGVRGDYRSGQSKLVSAASVVSSNIGNFSNGDIIGLAADMDNKALYVHLNGTYYQVGGVTGVPTSGASKTGALTIPATCVDCIFFVASYTSDAVIVANFGNGYFGTTAVTSAENPDDGIGIFEYDVPAGYRALCTTSLNATEYS